LEFDNQNLMGAALHRFLIRYTGVNKILPLSLLAIVGISFFFFIKDYQNGLRDSKRIEIERLKAIVSTASALIDGDAHEQISESFRLKDDIIKSDQTPRYQELHEILKAIQISNKLSTAIYTMVYDSTAEKFQFIGTSSTTPYYRHDY